MNKKLFASQIAFIIIVMLMAAGCSGNAPAPTVASTALPTISLSPTQTREPRPTETPKPTATSAPTKEKVTFKSGDLTLVGYLFKPSGAGPFPALIWNHGSEQDPDKGAQFDGVASIFVPAGYVVLTPMRRGHGESQGPYIADQIQQERKAKGDAAADLLTVQLHEGPQLDDQLAGLAYLKNLTYVDKNRLGVIGCSYGGIQTLLAAERGAGFRAALPMSPAAESWVGNPPLQQRLIKAVSGINMPVFLIHPAKDASLLPGQTLAKEFQRLNKPFELKIYPDTVGTPAQQAHCFGGFAVHGQDIWSADALAFFNKYLK